MQICLSASHIHLQTSCKRRKFWVIDGGCLFDSVRVRQLPSLHSQESTRPLQKGAVIEELERHRDWIRHNGGWSVVTYDNITMLRRCTKVCYRVSVSGA